MNRNYPTPKVSAQWADVRNTDMVVAVAIHAIADSNRSPEAIWEAPTSYEFDAVCMAIEEFITSGDYTPEDAYNWGDHRITINA